MSVSIPKYLVSPQGSEAALVPQYSMFFVSGLCVNSTSV